jgi:hypothetical protein
MFIDESSTLYFDAVVNRSAQYLIALLINVRFYCFKSLGVGWLIIAQSFF